MDLAEKERREVEEGTRRKCSLVEHAGTRRFYTWPVFMDARHTRVPMAVIYVLKSGDDEVKWRHSMTKRKKEMESEVDGHFRKR